MTINPVPVRRSSSLPPIDCVCATVRRAARLLTQLYDEELRPQIEVPQFALLMALERNPGCRQSSLAKAAGFDKTTISRNLALMRRNSWIEEVPSDDSRDRRMRLTTAGRNLLRAAKPRWARAQKRLSAEMTPGEWEQMWRVLDNLTNAAVTARQESEA
jgi:DNA-binding MarR family transcriptional regulator